ncbi:MAG: hypothetical protein ABSF46_07240 [Terriglobia bacterium]|jgi:anti-anti-sigma regulatory factor
MWKLRKLTDRDCIVLNISGRIVAEELSELEKAVQSETTGPQKVELDLEQVSLVDQQAVTFFARCEAAGTQLRNCLPYIREWIARESVRQNRKRES